MGLSIQRASVANQRSLLLPTLESSSFKQIIRFDASKSSNTSFLCFPDLKNLVALYNSVELMPFDLESLIIPSTLFETLSLSLSDKCLSISLHVD